MTNAELTRPLGNQCARYGEPATYDAIALIFEHSHPEIAARIDILYPRDGLRGRTAKFSNELGAWGHSVFPARAGGPGARLRPA